MMTTSGDVKRLFFAIDLPDATVASAERLIETFDMPPTHVRWVRHDSMHLTLKFLGETETKKIPAITKAVRAALSGFSPFHLTVEGMGIFPNHDRPRVVWFGVGGDTEDLAAMEKAVSGELEKLGFPPDERPFTAHLTIGRVKSFQARGKLVRLLRQHQHEYIGEAPVNRVVLYESRLDTAGAIYSIVETFELEGED